MSGLAGSLALAAAAGRVRKVMGAVPWQVWAILGLCLAVFIGVKVHAHKVSALKSERYSAGYRAGYDAALSDARKLQIQAETIGNSISLKLRNQNNETLRAIDRLSDDLRLRGPGKAACSYPAANPPAAGGHKQAGGSADASVDQVPDREREPLIGLPFSDAISFAEQHDANRAEVLTWRQNDKEQREARANLKEHSHEGH